MIRRLIGARRRRRMLALAATMGQGQGERMGAILATTRRCRENAPRHKAGA